MTAIDTSLPLATQIRINIQDAVADKRSVNWTEILERIQADGKVSAAELRALQQAVAAEADAGTIDQKMAKHIMTVIVGRLAEGGSAEDRQTIRDTVSTFDTLAMTGEQVTGALEWAKRAEDRGLLAKEVRIAGADGKITAEELDALWAKALGRDGTVSGGDVRVIYAALEQLHKMGKIDDKQLDALRKGMDASLAARAGRKDVDQSGVDYIIANNTGHKVADNPLVAATWSNAIDMMEFATKDAGDGRKLSFASVVAFADMVKDASNPISDAVAAAVADGVEAALAAGNITAADARALAKHLDRRIALDRFGAGAKADFDLVFSKIVALNPPPAPTPTPDTTPTITPRTGTGLGTVTLRTAPQTAADDAPTWRTVDRTSSSVAGV